MRVGATKLALAEFLAPVPLETFFAEYYDQKYLHVRREQPAYWDGLLTERWLLDATWQGLLTPALLEIKQLGAKIDPSQLFDEMGASYDLDALHDEYNLGATFHYINVEAWCEPISQLCEFVKTTLRAQHTYANAFITTGPTLGTQHSIHWDPADAFIFQLAGAKDWTLYESPLPFTKRFYQNDYEPGTITAEFTTRAGDFLYLPRGHFHAANTETYSTHVVCGIEALSITDVICGLADVLNNSAQEFRHVAANDQDALAPQIESALATLAAYWRDLLPHVTYEPKFRIPYA